MKGFITYPDYKTEEDVTKVYLYGRAENGESFVTVNTVVPYFFIKEEDQKAVEEDLKPYTIEKTELTTFAGEKVVKVNVPSQTELNKLTKKIYKEAEVYEGDIKPHFRFMMDHNLLGTVEITGDAETSEKVNNVFNEPVISAPKEKVKTELKIASIDIETSKTGGELFCIGIYAGEYQKVFMISENKLKNAISCKDEEECLEKFKEAIHELDPDIITGWNVIDFDLGFLKNIFEKHKVRFDLGRNNDNARVRIEGNFFKSSSADITGRQVIDGLISLRDPFIKEAPSIKQKDFSSYTLENVAQEILGAGKLLKGSERHNEIEDLYKGSATDQEKLAEYNLLDCKLVYDILEETKIIELATERSQLTGMPLNRQTASIAAFDSLYIRKARIQGLVSPSTHFVQKEERITGGYVQSPTPGIYHNVIILDFKSLYPSIIKTFNIDPASHLAEKEKGSIEAPNKTYFKNTNGVLPEIIKTLHEARENAKKEGRELASYAIKIIMNSFFGVLASPNCRYFSLDVANAITHFGQYLIKLTAEEIEKKGYHVLYSDTDSVFVDTDLGEDKANVLGKKIEKEINTYYDDLITKKYKRTSGLELEFEKQYLSMMFPKQRGAEGGAAKKRYAGLINKKGKEELEIIGLEAIRGDWTAAAQNFQKKLLMKIFHKEPVEKFIREYIKKIQDGKMDDQLIYKKSLRKPLNEYVKTTPPHVKAARKLKTLESKIIFYYITTDGPEPKQQLKHPLNYEHYIDKQIKPIANQILELQDKTFNEVQDGTAQAKLF